MRRRDFIAGLGGAAAWPMAARAQQSGRMKRVGVLMGLAESDPEGQARISAFRKTLQGLGWIEGMNIQIDYRWAGGDIERTRSLAVALVKSAPDVIVVNTPPGSSALRQETSTIPIVFVQVLDASESGLVANPAKPEANVTGFTNFYEYAMAGKWLQLLKETVPSLRRVAIMQNPNHPSWVGYLDKSTTAGASLGLQVVPTRIYAPEDIDNLLNAFAHEPDGGLLVLPDTFTTVHRRRIIDAAARGRLPAVYPLRFFAAYGGLMSYGADLVEMLRLAATYVSRILRGEAPSDLPVQSSTKFELVINLKTANALGLTIPETLLATADEVFQ
jgi:putative ABC transport system substrate-binding protein